MYECGNSNYFVYYQGFISELTLRMVGTVDQVTFSFPGEL